jgi:ABC-type Fe3+/spermidine/putrescine transport system ATPase subunit
MAKLRLENVTKRYGDEIAVDNLSISVPENQVKALLGPSGCGKTTLLRMVAGFEELDEGSIYIDDQVVSNAGDNIQLSPQKRDIGMVFQSLAIWPHMTVEENVKFPLQYKDSEEEETENHEEKVRNILETVGLEKHQNSLAPNLSGGQQQRVALARALVTEPNIILFDEPLTALDSQLRRSLRNEINRICNKVNVTALYVTHSQDEAMYLCDELALMNDGSIVEEGPPQSLYNQPDTFFGMNFMGRSNKISCTVVDTNPDWITLEPDLPLDTIQVRQDGSDISTNQQVILSFRPKVCSLKPTNQSNGSNDQDIIFDGKILSRGVTRDFTEFTIDVHGEEMIAHVAESTPLDEGDLVSVSVDPTGVRVFDLSQDYEH